MIPSLSSALAIAVALVMIVSPLRDTIRETRDDARYHVREAGFVPQPLPAALVAAARTTLRPGDTWTLVTPSGACEADQYRFFWLAFRLLPRIADCRTPRVRLYWQVRPSRSARIVAQGPGFWIVRA